MHTSADHSAGEDAPLFLAGRMAPAGMYLLVGTVQEVRLDKEDVLPATYDGQVAVYVRLPTTWGRSTTLPEDRARGRRPQTAEATKAETWT